MDKVKITQEQADAIEAVKYIGNEEVVRQHSLDTGTLWDGAYRAINDLSLNILIKALYIGYEVEETPEDKVREYYNQQNSISTASMDTGADVIRKVLNLLGKEIEGVNV